MRKVNTCLIVVNLTNALWHWRAWHGAFHIYTITLFSEQWPPANCLSLYCASTQKLPGEFKLAQNESLQRLFLPFNCICAYYWMSIFPCSKLVMSYYHVFRISFDTLDVRSQICLKLFFLFALLVFENLLKIEASSHNTQMFLGNVLDVQKQLQEA